MMYKPLLAAGVAILTLSACTSAQLDRLKEVGKAPALEEIQNPQEKSAPVTWPKERSKNAHIATANSLWSHNSKDFFRDQRAYRVGDILTVTIMISDKAELDNKTESKRSGRDSLAVPQVFGMQEQLTGWLPGNATPSSLLDVTGSMDNSGEGIIEREEQIDTEVAAVVTQVMDNGNLVIYGSQEIRVNFEVRQLTVEGVVRPEDVSPSNTVDSNRIAEARISYGGKGLISEVQQPRLGHQITDILAPW